MEIEFLATIAVIAEDPAASRRLIVGISYTPLLHD